MIDITKNKLEAMKRLSDENGIISALAIDQRGSLKKMLNTTETSIIIEFKKLISSELTPFASSILLDPEYGIEASKVRSKNSGLLMAYEKTGYDATKAGRLPDLLDDWSVKRLKDLGADSIKFLLYYDVDEDIKINEQKHIFIERLGAECLAHDIPFFLELLAYDANIKDSSSLEYAKVKPNKVIKMMKEFSKPQYYADVLKVEVPVNMNFVEGFSKEASAYTQDEAGKFFKEQSDCTNIPFIFLSAGVSAKMFNDTLEFAHKNGSKFNGVLCGRATWKDSTDIFAKEGSDACKKWLSTQGKANMDSLNTTLNKTATSWHTKVV
jgi:tagatose 1,6-diphosphate aldolase